MGSNPTPRTIRVTPSVMVPDREKILQYAWHLKKEGYRERTITSRVKLLNGLSRRADLFNPEAVKGAIARLDVTEGRKEILVCVYGSLCRLNNIPFLPPRYQRVERLPFIPQETEIDQLIAGTSRKCSVYLQFLKETGARAGEAWNLRWIDLEFERMAVTLIPEKGSNPRQIKVSSKLFAMLNQLPRRHERVFGPGKLDHFARWFYVKRRDVSQRLGNPRIRRIGFKTLRHWRASTLYHKTRDILLVQRTLGHKDIRNTLVYTHLIDLNEDDFACKAARTLDEASKLIEVGFDFVTEFDGVKLFRERK